MMYLPYAGSWLMPRHKTVKMVQLAAMYETWLHRLSLKVAVSAYYETRGK